MKPVKVLALAASVCVLALMPIAWMQTPPEAPTGFDNLTNGHTDQATFDANKVIFEELEEIDEGLGPVFNMRGCGECHGNPVTGAGSQITELRAGHFNGTSFVSHPGDSLIHSQAIHPDIQEHILDGNEVRSFRTSLNVLGDGFVEAISNTTLQNNVNAQNSTIRGTLISVPVVEANGPTRIGRFGHKDQQASLLSFSGDAYLNEMGITNCVPDEVPRGIPPTCTFGKENSSNGISVADFDEVADPEDAGEDVEAFAQFMRATKAPPRGPITLAVSRGSALFDQIAGTSGCNNCHIRTIVTADAGTLINGGALRVSAALGGKQIHPFSDFALHDVGTGDGIVQNGGPGTRTKVRTAALWGVRVRNRLMHDGLSLTFNDAILNHGGPQGTLAANAYRNLSASQKADLIAFLKSL